MPIVNKSVIVPCPCEMMYSLVTDIDNYCKYLPWCGKSAVISSAENTITGKLDFEYLKVKIHLLTKNINIPYSSVTMNLVEGPFKHLQGQWHFTALGTNKDGCKIDFMLEYQFVNSVLEKLISPAFNYIANNIVNAFIKQALLLTPMQR